MKIEIKHQWDGVVLFSIEAESMKLAVEAAIRSGADLRDANLSGANLSGADLSGVKNIADFTMTDGLKFSEYLAKAVPALLTAGGKTLREVVDSGCWNCHSWDNCPMRVAFGIDKPEDAPPIFRARVREFVQFFDANLIPEPKIDRG